MCYLIRFRLPCLCPMFFRFHRLINYLALQSFNLNVPDVYYSRNVPYTLNLISTIVFRTNNIIEWHKKTKVTNTKHHESTIMKLTNMKLHQWCMFHVCCYMLSRFFPVYLYNVHFISGLCHYDNMRVDFLHPLYIA